MPTLPRTKTNGKQADVRPTPLLPPIPIRQPETLSPSVSRTYQHATVLESWLITHLETVHRLKRPLLGMLQHQALGTHEGHTFPAPIDRHDAEQSNPVLEGIEDDIVPNYGELLRELAVLVAWLHEEAAAPDAYPPA